MKIAKNILTFVLTALCMTACVVNDDAELTAGTSSDTSDSTSSSAKLTAVSISGGATSISYNGSTTFKASATYTGNPTITYSWEVTNGSAFATISGDGETATLTVNNTSSSTQTIEVTVTASYGSTLVSDKAEVTVSASGVSVKDEITAVSLSAASETISSSGKTKVSASPTYTGSPSITYSWEITEGSGYAYFTSEGEGVTSKTTQDDGDCKITGCNTTEQAQSVIVKVTASDGENSFEDSVTITVAAKAALSESYNSEATVDTSTYSNVIYVDLENGLVSADNANWEEITTSAVQPIDSIKVKFTEDDDGLSTGLIKIDATDFSEKIAVYLSGKMSAGGVKIQSNASDTVAVYLNDAEITSTNYPCVEVTKGSPAIVDISGTNVFVDGRKYGTGYGEEYSTVSGDTYTEDGTTYSCTVSKSVVSEGSDSKGSLYSKGNLTVTGSGSLSVTQAYKNCIASKAILTIESGTYTLTSTGKSGLYGDQGVVVNDGSITFTGSGAVSSSAYHKAHGINTDDENYASSYVTIRGGSLDFTISYGKGITAPVVNIAGGTNIIKISSPTSKVLDTSASYYDADGVKTSETVSFAPQGIDGGTVTISGGSTTITSPWSGINSDGNITVSDGTVTITTSADGVYDSSESDYTAPSCLNADGNIVITGGTVTGTNSGKGGKGVKADGTYTQSAGSVNVKVTGSNLGSSSSSSGFSRSGSSSSSSSSASASAKGVKINGAISVSGGKLYATSSSHEAIESKSTITVSGGEVYGYSASDDGINASSHFTITGGYVCGYAPNNDGLDSNGNFYIKGGLVYAIGSSSPEVAIDANTEGGYKLYITGGTVIAVGPLESGASLSQSCYKASSWSKNTWYCMTAGGTNYVFKTPSSGGSGLVLSASSTPTLTSGATASGTSYFDGILYVGGSAGTSSVSLSSYSSSSSSGGFGPGGR